MASHRRQTSDATTSFRPQHLSRDPSPRCLSITACPGLADRGGNPYTRLTHEPMVALGGTIREFSFYRPVPSTTDVLHIHWPERIFWGRISRLHPLHAHIYAKSLIGQMDRVRGSGGIVAWTAHNLAPHEPLDASRRRIWKSYMETFCSKVDLLINLTAEAENKVLAAYPRLEGVRAIVAPHPHYRQAYPPRGDRTKARAALGIGELDYLLVSVGTVRKNKGIVELASAFLKSARAGEKFLIAGQCPDPNDHAHLASLASASGGALIFQPGHATDSDIATIYSGADLAVFNFRDILNSGTVMLALTYEVPVCAPELGSLKELSAKIGPDWFTPLCQPLSTEAFRTSLDAARRTSQRGDRSLPMHEYDPMSISESIYRAYCETLARRQTALVASARP